MGEVWGELGDFLKKDYDEKEPKNWIQRHQFILLESIILVGIYIFLFSALKMEWFLRDIIPIGGDVPYHFANYIDLKEILLPNFQISGWSDASFGGFQLFQSYPILPFLLIYFFDLFMGSGVAFKVVLIMGAVGLPFATYWTLMQSKTPRPGPIFGAILSLAYLFHDDHFAFGGNLRSVFSGEFAHSLSILFLVIFCGFLFKAFENKKYIPHAIISLSFIGFTHPIAFAVGFFLPLGFLIIGPQKVHTDRVLQNSFLKRGSIAFKIMTIGGLLFCTWAIGYYINSGHNITDIVERVARPGGYGWGINFHYLIPKLLLPFSIAFLLMVTYIIFTPEKNSQAQILFLWGIYVSLGLFLIKFMGASIRFLPGLYLFVMLFLATAIGNIYKNIKNVGVFIIFIFYIFSSVGFIYYYVYSNNLFNQYRGTSGYNFMGIEVKKEWPSLKLISQFLSENFDTQTENQEKTTPPRIFSYDQGDLFRAISRASLYDGLFGNSSFHMLGKITGKKINKKIISPEKFWHYMVLSNTHIIIAPEGSTKYLSETPYFSPIKKFGPYTLFETKNTPKEYVVPLKYKTYALSDFTAWKKTTHKWYADYNGETSFIVYNPDQKDRTFPTYDKERKNLVPYTKKCTAKEIVQREKIQIKTDCIGRPLLVKFAYHQNWQVIGAKKVYRATPSFMIVVPETNDVTLYYGKRTYNYIAYACGILGIILFFTYGYIENIFSRWTTGAKIKYKKLFQLLNIVANKLKLPIIGDFYLQNSASCLAILVLLLSIAFVYVNKG